MRILIEVNSNIGDLVMNLPILNYFNNNFTELSIDVIADKKSANLLSETSYIKNIYIKEKKNKEKFKLFFKLSKFKYDLAIGLRSDAVPLVIRASKKLYKNDRDKKLLNKCSETLYHYSILKKYFEYNEKLIDTHIDFNVKTLEYAKKLVDYKENDEILFIGPGANAEEKIWPKENYIELINLIKSKFNKIVIVGAPDEYDLCEEVSIKTSSINLAKKTNLVQISALLSLGSLFIGNDSGLGHISAAQSVKTLSIFAYANPIRYTPFKQHSIFREDLDIKKISVKDVLDKLVKENLI